MYQWDENNVAHLERHGVTPVEAEQVISNLPLDLERQIRGRELRTVHLGVTDASRVLLVVTTMRDNLIRVVTAYDAKKRLQTFYRTQRSQPNARTAKEARNT